MRQTWKQGEEPPMRGITTSFPCPRYCGDFAIHIRRDGQWLYRGSPIGRKSLCQLFASVLHRDSDDAYWLVTPAERGRISVELAPFFVSDFIYCSGLLRLKTTLDEWVSVDVEHPIFMDTRRPYPQPKINEEVGELSSSENSCPEVLPYFRLRPPRLDALISRNVFYALAEYAEYDNNNEELFFIRSGQERFTLDISSTPNID